MSDLNTVLSEYREHIVKDYFHRYTGIVDPDRYTVEFEPGSKYIKVVSVSWGSRSVHSFVEKANGNIWRAASWKAPARNFVRGNVYDPSTYVKRTSWTGVV